MIVGFRPNLKKLSSNASKSLCILIGDTNIDTVQNAKYLGVILDQHLVRKERLKVLQIKISRALAFLKYVKKCLPMEALS